MVPDPPPKCLVRGGREQAVMRLPKTTSAVDRAVRRGLVTQGSPHAEGCWPQSPPYRHMLLRDVFSSGRGRG